MEKSELETLDTCLYCGNSNIDVQYSTSDFIGGMQGTFFLSTCNDCGLMFQNPRVTESEVRKYYEGMSYYTPKSYRDPHGFFSTFLLKHVMGYFGGKVRNDVFSLFLKRVFKISSYPDFVPGGTLLEVGCSHGYFLEKMKTLGWNAYGVEPYATARKYAKEQRGLDVFEGNLEQFLESNTTKFDVIVMNMVVEHLYDPFSNISGLIKFLKPGGTLIFSIPYGEGFEFSYFKKYTYDLNLPLHISFPNRRLLTEFLEKNGCTQASYFHHMSDRNVVASSKFKYQETKQKFFYWLRKNKIIRYLVVKPVVILASLLGKTSRVTVFAKKK